ncbi:hypothetical protein ACFFR3_40265 [Nonomuraea salmonea]|uniref:Nuclear transport factor 2 family protein n=1 Tax=Nonomuraea salmonea TaxID=46181 RepID=A0ABV5NZP4_9ACTN
MSPRPLTLTAVATALALAGCAADPGSVATERVTPRPRASLPVTSVPVTSVPVTSAPPTSGSVMFGPGSATPTPSRSTVAALDPASIDQRDADTVSTAVLTAMWSVDTTTDHDQRDAALRAAGWLSPEYLAELRDGPQVGTDAAWATWAAHRARTRASLTEGRDTRPPDTATQADRQWQLTVTPIGADGWRGEPLAMTAFVALERPKRSAPWRVTAVTLR